MPVVVRCPVGFIVLAGSVDRVDAGGEGAVGPTRVWGPCRGGLAERAVPAARTSSRPRVVIRAR
jgi:hypothetical protein